MTGARFRLATAADAGIIQSMLEDLARQDGATMTGSAEALIRHGFGRQALFQTVLAERETEVLGLALFYPEFSTLRGCPGVFVQDLFVSPEARGMGLGRALLAQVMAVAQGWEAAYLTLMVGRSNTQARGFYEKNGFVERGDYQSLILSGAGLDALREGVAAAE